MKKLIVTLLLAIPLTLPWANLSANETTDSFLSPLQFVSQKIESAKSERGLTSTSLAVEFEQDTSLAAQSYTISRGGNKDKTVVTVKYSDTRGLIYGGLEVAERIQFQKEDSLNGIYHTPHIKKRGIKFNIPLDVRIPSFDDNGDAAQRNIQEMWNFEFWKQFLDRMAIHRYNAITLWNSHPFPVMTKIPGYEDVALNDVCVTTLDLETQQGQWGPSQLTSRPVMENLKVIKPMTIDEKIEFWRKVMRYGKERGIDFYFITWNICANTVALPVEIGRRSWEIERESEKPGKYGVTHQIDNPKTQEYYRAAVKSFVLTYPDLKGIGITAGENMPSDQEGVTPTREQWLWETYGLGILDAKKEQPDRKIDFIHRVWYSDMDKIMKYWQHYPDTFEVSFKYAKARLYSSPKVPFADSLVEDLEPLGLKSWWNLRNDDIFYHRWGDPDYVRDFILNFPEETTAGFHMGSDGYVWGREFVSKSGPDQNILEIDKHWYRFQLWGRLGYNPELDRSYFLDVIKYQYPSTETELLHDSWASASKVFPLINRFHWRNWDFMWVVEGSKSGRKYRDVFDFYGNSTMEGNGILNVKDYVTKMRLGESIDAITPLQIAAEIETHATQASMGIVDLATSEGTQVHDLINDIRSMAWLGKFYASKIRATVALGYFLQTSDLKYRAESVEHLKTGLKYLKKYVTLNNARYNTQVFSRTGKFDWQQLLLNAEQEIEKVASHENDFRVQLGRERIIESLEGKIIGKKLVFEHDETIGKEAYQIDVSKDQITISGGDSTGLMYGAYDLAEQLRMVGRNHLKSKSEQPEVDFRGIKFNLPWSSYRKNPALSLHTETCKDLKFWESFLDMMVENRFNALTLWNLHPFPYMVAPKSFPEVVEGREAEFKEWQKFYRSLFKMAKDRGIETYIVNWNIFIDPKVAKKHGVGLGNLDHKHWGAGEDEDSPIIRKYMRECVTQVIDEYPNLTGLGFSLGERMGGFTPPERQEWIMDTFIKGIEAANRKIKLIHRVPFSADLGNAGSTDVATEVMTRKAMESIDCVEEPIIVEIKFNWSHAHSSPKLVKVHGGAISDAYWNPKPKNYQISWMMRNEDFFCLRWGVPNFIREHISLNNHDYVGGYFVGSECYIPAVDFFTKHEGPLNWDYAFQRQWAFYQQWGRLLYNPEIPDQVFQQGYIDRYGKSSAKLQEAYALASQMPLLHGTLLDLGWDFTLYSEGFIGKKDQQSPIGFISLETLIEWKTLDPDYLNIAEYAQLQAKGQHLPKGRKSPIELAEQLESNALEALKLIDGLEPNGDVAYTYEIADVKIWSALSRYFAFKIRAGVAYETAKLTHQPELKVESMVQIESAINQWKTIIELTEDIYKPMPLLHTSATTQDKYFHWSRLLKQVEADRDFVELLDF